MRKEETLYLKLIYVNIYYMSNININKDELLKTKFLFQRLKQIIQKHKIKSKMINFQKLYGIKLKNNIIF